MDALEAVLDGKPDEAAEAIEHAQRLLPTDAAARAERLLPHVRRAARKLPTTAAELMPLLRQRTAAGPVLRALRGKLGMTQYELAEHIGMSRITLSHVEAGRQSLSLPAAEKLFALTAERIDKALATATLQPEALIRLREALNMSRERLSKELGSIGAIRLARLETGNATASVPEIATLKAYAAKHGLNLDHLAAAA